MGTSFEEYRREHLLRRFAGGELWAVRDPRPAVLLLVEDGFDRGHLEAIAEAHDAVKSPCVAPLLAFDRDRGLLFDCAAEADLERVVDAAQPSGVRLGFGGAVAFSDLLLDTLQAAHTTDPPHCMGALAWRNILIDADGGCWLFGLGHNFLLKDGAARWLAAPGVAIPAGVALGAPASPAADASAHFALIRTLLPWVELYGGFSAAIEGRPDGGARRMAEHLSRLSGDLQARPLGEGIVDIATLRQRYRAVRALDPSMPAADERSLRAFFAELVQAMRGPAEMKSRSTTSTLYVGERELELRGQRIGLRARPLLWRLIMRLVEARQRGEGALSVWQLMEAGWPDERIEPQSGLARVYVALSTLRKLGLEEVLTRDEHGYQLSVAVARSGS
ncbi:MAG: hypothetical protein AAGA56_08795 [Myxococcota bacterium]